MDCSAPIRALRSTIVAAFLTPALTGCGNAQAGDSQRVAADSVQDWETQPPLWVPRPIVFARATPAASQADSSRADSSRSDSTQTDSTLIDSVTTPPANSVSGAKAKRAVPVQAAKRA